MNTQDVWFEPGDKVIRVAYAYDLGLPLIPQRRLTNQSDFGNVLCVERCFRLGDWNRVSFVGIKPTGILPDRGWYACCFRRVEEIQLCVRAAEKFKQPQTENV
jgi:hypothetical protein